jgi:hypothetical protein
MTIKPTPLTIPRPAAQLHPLAEALIAAITADAYFSEVPISAPKDVWNAAEDHAIQTRDRALAAFADIALSPVWVAKIGRVF